MLRSFCAAALLGTLVLIAGCRGGADTFAPPAAPVGERIVHASSGLSYHLGPVLTQPAIYIDFWGFNSAKNDPNGEAAYLTNFLSNAGGSPWLGTITQYYESTGSKRTYIKNSSGMVRGIWYDDSRVDPAIVQDEASNAAQHFGAFGQSDLIVVVLPTGAHPHGFGSPGGWCTTHNLIEDSSNPPTYYMVVPYQSDEGSYCQTNAVNHGAQGVLDGVSINAGGELADTITNPTFQGWFDSADRNAEISTLCHGVGLQDTAIGPYVFATHALWSNARSKCTQAAPAATPTPAPSQTQIASGFHQPAGIAVQTPCTASCVIYVANRAGTANQAVEVINPGGKVSAIATKFGWENPSGVAVDAKGNVFVADTQDWTIEKIAAQPYAVTQIGSGFDAPNGVALDSKGDVYVADTASNLVQRVATNGTIETLGSGFLLPVAVAVDASGNVYVADSGNNAVKKIDTRGKITTLGSGFHEPHGVAVDIKGNVYVADYGNGTVDAIAPNGVQTTIGSFKGPNGVALDPAGNLYVSDVTTGIVWKVVL